MKWKRLNKIFPILLIVVQSGTVNISATVPNPTTPISSGGGGGGGYYIPYAPPNSQSGEVNFHGLAYPGSQVTILEDGSVAAATTADQGAQFNVSINNLSPGVYSFSLYSVDPSGNRSPNLNFFETLSNDTKIDINNILTAPTINVDKVVLKKGDVLNVFGYTTPNSVVQLFVHSDQAISTKTQSSSAGSYFHAFDTSDLELGEHILDARTELADAVSPYSSDINFNISDQNSQSSNFSVRKYRLSDLSVLLYWWHQHNSKIDLNGDGYIDLTDLSILLYWWEG